MREQKWAPPYILIETHVTPVRALICHNEGPLPFQALSHARQMQGGMREAVPDHILPVLSLQTLHRPLFTHKQRVHQESEIQFLEAEYGESVSSKKNPTSSGMMSCFPRRRLYQWPQYFCTPAVFHASSRILRLSKQVSATSRQQLRAESLENRTGPFVDVKKRMNVWNNWKWMRSMRLMHRRVGDPLLCCRSCL